MEEKCKFCVRLQGNCTVAGEENMHRKNMSTELARRHRSEIQEARDHSQEQAESSGTQHKNRRHTSSVNRNNFLSGMCSVSAKRLEKPWEMLR